MVNQTGSEIGHSVAGTLCNLLTGYTINEYGTSGICIYVNNNEECSSGIVGVVVRERVEVSIFLIK
jgi:hypothetical protein